MATLVLAATATPARVVGCRQDCGRLSGGWVIHDSKATGCIWQAKRPLYGAIEKANSMAIQGMNFD